MYYGPKQDIETAVFSHHFYRPVDCTIIFLWDIDSDAKKYKKIDMTCQENIDRKYRPQIIKIRIDHKKIHY